MRYVCSVCNYVYDPDLGDPESGVQAETGFAQLPEDWVCPDCQVEKVRFYPSEEQHA